MYDHRSAATFGAIFAHLAKHPDDRNRELARWLWDGPMRGCDFVPQQLECDNRDLSVLDLRRRGVSPEFPRDGEMTLYRGDPGFDEAPAVVVITLSGVRVVPITSPPAEISYQPPISSQE